MCVIFIILPTGLVSHYLIMRVGKALVYMHMHVHVHVRQVFSGASWRGDSEFCCINQVYAMWLAYDYHVTLCYTHLRITCVWEQTRLISLMYRNLIRQREEGRDQESWERMERDGEGEVGIYGVYIILLCSSKLYQLAASYCNNWEYYMYMKS